MTKKNRSLDYVLLVLFAVVVGEIAMLYAAMRYFTG